MATKRLTRLVIPVELDDSKTASSLTNLKEVITQTSQQISRSMENALPVADITKASINIIRSIGNIQAAAKTAATGVKSETDKIGKALQEAFGVDAANASAMMQKFLEMRGTERAVTQLKNLQREYGLTSAEAIEFARSVNASEEVLRRFSDAQAQTKQSGRGVSGLLTPYSLTSGVQAAAGAVGVSFGMYGAAELTKSVVQATTALDNLNASFESIYGDSASAGQSLEFVRKISDELGLSFLDTAQAAKSLFASAKGTILENDAQMIFKSFSQMGAALKLSGSQMDSVFLAVSQMISKGKVSAEELRLQLSEAMPGAVNIFAKAIGKTTEQLDDMLQKGQVGLEDLRVFAEEVGLMYADGAEGASQSLQAEINRLSNAWFDLKTAMMDSGDAAEFVRALTEITKFIGQNIDAIMSFVKWLGIVYATLKVTTAFSVAIGALKSLRKAFVLTGAAAAQTSGIMKTARAVIASFALAFNTNPIGLTITAIVAVGAAVYSLSNQMSESEKFISGYAKSFDEIIDKSEKVAESQEKLSDSNKHLQEQYLNERYLKRQKDFVRILQEIPSILATTKVTDYSDYMLGPLSDVDSEGLFALRDKAVKLAKETRDAISNALNEEGDTETRDETITNALDRFKIMFRAIKDGMKDAGAPEDAIKQWDNLGGAILNAKNTVDATKAALEALTGEAGKSGKSLAEFAKAYDEILKNTGNTEYGKQLLGRDNIESQIRGLLQMSEALSQLVSKTQELSSASAEQQNASTLTEEKTKELEAAFDSISARSEQLDSAFRLVAESAMTSGADASTLNSIIENLGETFHLSAQDIDDFKAKLNSALSESAIQSAERKLASVEAKLATVGSKSSRAALSALSSIKELKKGQEEQILAAIESGDYTGLLSANGNKIAADVAKIYKEIAEKTEALVAAEDAARSARQRRRRKLPEFDIEGFDVRVQKLFGTESNFAKIVDAEIEKLNDSLATHRIDIKKVADIYRDELPEGLHSVADAQEFLSNKLREGLIAKQMKKEKDAIDGLREKLMDFERSYSEVVSGDDNAAALKSYKKQANQWKDTANKIYRSITDSAFTSVEERIAAEQEYADTVIRIDEWMAEQKIRTSGGVLDNLKIGVEDYYDQHKNFALGLGEVVNSTTDAMASALSNFVVGGMQDFRTFGEAFDSLVNDMIRSLSKLLAQQLMSGILQSALSIFAGGAGKGAGTDNAVSFSTWFGGLNKKANGGVMTGISNHSNSIVSSPTLFSYGKEISQYANGAGLMGEAGPEAIMPLTRTSSGKLGVLSKRENESSRPVHSSSSDVFVNVYNSTGQKARAKQTQNANGSKSIDVIIGDVAAQQMLTPGTKANYAIRTQTGATPPTIKR